MAQQEVTVNETNMNEPFGPYVGNNGPFNGINFTTDGDFLKPDWFRTHYITKIHIQLSNLNTNHRLNLFATDFCPDSNTLEIHVATGDVDIMPEEEDKITFLSNSFTEVSLDPNDPDENLQVKYYVYAYHPETNTGDLYFRKCGGPREKIPVYREPNMYAANKDRWAVDPQPDVQNGNVVVGRP